MTRYRLLAVAAGVGVVAGVLLIAQRALKLSDINSLAYHLGYQTVAAWFYLVGSVALAVAFCVALAGLLRSPRERRTQMLAVAGGLFAAYGIAILVSDLITVVETWSAERTWLFKAAGCSAAAGDLTLLVAAGVVAVGVLAAAPNRVLGWGCLVLGTSFAFAAAGYWFALAGVYHLGSPPGRYAGGVVTVGAGQTLAAAGAVMAAIAFLTGGSRRDRGLAVAAVIFFLAFLVTAIGWTLFATLGGEAERENWLFAVFEFLLALAAAVGAAAFTREAAPRA